MPEVHREQHPLLYDDLSEEEHFSPHRRLRPRMAFRSRISNKVRGAATIFKRWPGYWSTALIYWWIGLGMILITTLLIYNVVTVFTLLPPKHNQPPMIRTDNTIKSQLERTSFLPEVFMHVFLNIGEEMDLNAYVPYIETLKNQYQEYRYNLVVVWNDTMRAHIVSAEERNDIALNSILYDTNIFENKDISGVITEQISLTKYMDTSPLNKYWRNIPYQFTEFMIRAIAIWDKGGIAFDPAILMPQSPPVLYDKLQHLLIKYMKKSKHFDAVNKISETNTANNYQNQKYKLNNIRDIINAMEQTDETKNNIEGKENKDLILEPAETRYSGSVILRIEERPREIFKNQETPKNSIYNTSKEPVTFTSFTEPSFLPALSKYFLHANSTDVKTKIDNIKIKPTSIVTRKRKSIINAKTSSNNKKDNKNKSLNEVEIGTDEIMYMPMIVPGNKSNNKMQKVTKQYGVQNVIESNYRSIDQLTIGLNGNILATNTSCHAFIGTLFNNVIHHEREETVTDLIINELTSFCKGILSSCDGIDVILV